MKYLQSVSQRAILTLGMVKLLEDLLALLEFAWAMFLSCQRVFSYFPPFTQNSCLQQRVTGEVEQAILYTVDYEEVSTPTSHPDPWVTADVSVWPGVASTNLQHPHTLVPSRSVYWSSNPSTALFPNKPAVLWVKLLTTCWGGVRSLQQGWCSLVTHCNASHHLMDMNSFIKASQHSCLRAEQNQTRTQGFLT